MLQNVQTLVKSMPKATLVLVPGKSAMDIWRDRTTMQTMTQFLKEGLVVEKEPANAQRRRGRKLADYPAGLSQREVEVLRFVAAGRTNKEIAGDLFISLNTVSYHLRNIFNKIGAANRTEAASFAHRHGVSVDLK